MAAITFAYPASSSAYCVGNDSTLPNFDAQYYSVSHEFARTKFVIRARVIRETWLGEDGRPKPLQPPFQNGNSRPWGFDPYLGAFYDVRVTRTFKGNPLKNIRLFSENSTARFWLNVGSDVFLFVTEETFDSPIGPSLTVDTCGNSATVAKAPDLGHELEKLANDHQ